MQALRVKASPLLFNPTRQELLSHLCIYVLHLHNPCSRFAGFREENQHLTFHRVLDMAGNDDWRKRADTHKMSNEDIRAAGVEDSKRPPGHNPGEVLHQRRKLPFSTTAMAVTGFLIAAAIGYSALYAKKKPEASARDVARVATGTAETADTHPRN